MEISFIVILLPFKHCPITTQTEVKSIINLRFLKISITMNFSISISIGPMLLPFRNFPMNVLIGFFNFNSVLRRSELKMRVIQIIVVLK